MKLRYIFITIVLSGCLFPMFVFAQDMAYPIEGDGILSFLRRWNRIDTSYVREFKELNIDRINAQGGLELGTAYLIPPLHPGDVYPAPEVIDQPTERKIFGNKYKDFAIVSDNLKDACFYIISGHGGPDPGATTRVNGHELHEDEYNYDFSLRLARNLMMQGAAVYMVIQDEYDGIRDERYLANNNGETCWGEPIPKSQIDRLKQRVEKVNDLYAGDKDKFKYVFAVEVHIDSRNPKKQIDLFLYYADNPQSRLTSYTLRDEVLKQYKKHQPNRGFSGNVSYRNLYILRELNPPAIMVEVGNFQNTRDRLRILDPNNRQAIANWMTNAFVEDYKRVTE
ncbi:MAG: N-acetylmuramoyl-L-alanine amidase family protein [Petrimonas sp.]|jgi:N-acetylmuramoyl-L-alanine amidase|nr:MAG: N-acetylmuramoyl-L-alanine amidase [Bacteroidetes bacterium ADurb.BinA174]